MRYTLLLGMCLLTACQTGYYQGPPSDHFNGKQFYYPGEEKKPRSLVSDWYNLAVSIWQNPWPNPLPAVQYVPIAKVPKGIKITFINHSSLLIETKKTNFLLDPIYAKRVSPFRFIGPARKRAAGITKAALPRIDVVLISHNHYDHMDMDFLQYLNHTCHPLFIVPLGNKPLMHKAHIDNVVEVDWWDKVPVNGTTITFLPAHHSAQRWLHDYNRTLWGSYGINVEGLKIYFAGDTGYANHFHWIRNRWGRPNFSLLPIGAYAPRELLHSDHLSPKEAVKVHHELGSHASLGIHWGTFKLSAEKFEQPPADLAIALKQAGISPQEFFIMPEGEPFYIR